MNRYDKTELMRELQDLRSALVTEANGPEAPPPVMHRDDARIFAQSLSGRTSPKTSELENRHGQNAFGRPKPGTESRDSCLNRLA